MTWQAVLHPALDRQDVDDSSLVMVLGPDSDQVTAEARRLGLRTGAPDLAAFAVPLVVGWDLGTPELGPPALVTSDAWLQAVRRLLLAVVGKHRVLALPGPVWNLMYLRRVFPDATYVLAERPGADPEWDARLPELRQPGDVGAGTAPPVPAGRASKPTSPGGKGDGLLILLGSGRSGTTWLHALLCASPAVSGTALGETGLFQMLHPIWLAHRRDSAVTDALRAFVQEVLVEPLTGPATALVCEKTPAHLWVIPFLRDLLPRAAFVHLVRDGRDVAISLHAVDGAYDDLRSAGEAWKRAVTTIERDLAGARRQQLVRYEDLLADPAGQVGQLWEWLQVPAGEQELAQRVGKQVSPLPSRRTPGSGRWGDLSPADLDEVVQGCGSALARWGYQA
jgi:hypothetical protein